MRCRSSLVVCALLCNVIIMTIFSFLYLCIGVLIAENVNENIESDVLENIGRRPISDDDFKSMFAEARNSLGHKAEKYQVSLALKYRDIMMERNIITSWHFLEEGSYNCTDGDVFYIKSSNFPNYPPGYPPNEYTWWEFMGDDSVANVKLVCTISTRWVKKCKTDYLGVSWGPGYWFYKRFCGVFVNKIIVKSKPVKVVFNSNDDDLTRLGFFCQVTCMAPIPTSSPVTEVTTTFMPQCHPPPTCARQQQQAYRCLDMVIPSHCECVDCYRGVTITCHLCTPCDLELFSQYRIMIPLTIDMRCDCPENVFEVNDYLCGNEEQLVTIEYCSNQNYTCVHDDAFPSNIKRVFKFCDEPFCYDTCNEHFVQCGNLNNAISERLAEYSGNFPGINRGNTALASEQINFECKEEDYPFTCAKRVSVCKPVIETGSYEDIGPGHHALYYDFTCSSQIKSRFLTLNDKSTVKSVHLGLSSSLINYIPISLRSLVVERKVDTILSYGPEHASCNSCNNAWLWTLSPAELSRLQAMCGSESGDVVTVRDYVGHNRMPRC